MKRQESSRIPLTLSRRALLQNTGLGFGGLALAHLLHSEGLLGPEPAAASTSGRMADLSPKQGHFPARAKAVIQLFQTGGPSQMDLFDPKPELQRRDGQKHPDELETLQPGSESHLLMASPFRFQPRGQCGMEFSELLPHIGSIADDLCLVRSMYGENNNHPQGMMLMHSGKTFSGHPTLGSWVSYGLGTESQNLPAYVVLRDPDGYNNGGSTNWQNGWLPALYRGTEIQTRGAPVLNLHPAVNLPEGVQRNNLDLLAYLNEQHRHRYPQESDLEARIRNYELAARMQRSAEESLDLSNETEATKKLYGFDNPTTAGYGKRCLMARRLVEAGVRFVQVFAPIEVHNMPWDNHGNLVKNITRISAQVDLPGAALIKDLKQRGLLDETIVIWTGEFGRLPITQKPQKLQAGRDHNRYGFGLFLAGGGFKAAHVHGATDDFGYSAVHQRVGVHDLLATILHQLGLDHHRLTYRHHGRDETLTDAPATNAQVVAELLKRAPEII